MTWFLVDFGAKRSIAQQRNEASTNHTWRENSMYSFFAVTCCYARARGFACCVVLWVVIGGWGELATQHIQQCRQER